ncbi:MAG: ABC transporter permease [Bacteroidota bacterium]
MNPAIALSRGLQAEVYKFRRTFLFWFLILAPGFVPAINLIIFLRRGHQIVEAGTNAWPHLLQMSIEPGNMLFPFFVMIVALFVNSIETTSNTWKLIYTQPLSRLTVYLSKVLVFILMLFVSLSLFGIFSIGVGWLVGIFMPDLGFDQAFKTQQFFLAPTRIYLMTLGYASLQFLISQQSKNLILPLGIGIGGLISFLILVQGWEYVEYHPYGFQFLGIGDYADLDASFWAQSKFMIRSLGLALVTFSVGAWLMWRKRIV